MKRWFNNGQIAKQFDDSQPIPKGFVLGRIVTDKMKNKHLSDETKLKLSNAHKGKTPWNKGKTITETYNWYTNGIKDIQVKVNEKPPEGFVKGVKPKAKYSDEQNESIIAKRQATCLEKYGNKNYNNTNKNKETCLKNYGVDNPQKSSIIRDKSRQTCIDRYGVDNPWKSNIVKEKIKQTNLERYGSSSYFSTLDFLNSQQDRNNNRTEEEWFEILEKRRKTCLEKYGVESTSKLPEVKLKAEQTNIEKYGVPYRCLASDFITKYGADSKPNLEFAKILDSLNIEYTREFQLSRYRYDFKVNNILIEIDPTFTHNSTSNFFNNKGIDKDYHFNKSMCAFDNNYKCVHIFDWDDIDKIIYIYFIDKKIIYARNCVIKLVDNKEKAEFLNKYHLQNDAKSKINIGLYYNEELVSLMTFDKPRYNKKYDYELIRYCSKYKIIGGAKKLFKYFLNNYQPNSIVSYCDRSKFNGETYEKLNFSLESIKSSKHWYNVSTKQHITDNLLRQRGFDQLFGTNYGKGTSNNELMLANKFVEIYDAGQARYAWYK